MTIKGIDLNMKWNDYPSDTLYLWNGNVLFVIAEGTGDNLLEEDEEEGYVDYWITECHGEDCDYDGGQWMETKLIADIDYTVQGVIDRIMECDLWDDDWIVLDGDVGESLQDKFDTYYMAEIDLKWELKKINKNKEDEEYGN